MIGKRSSNATLFDVGNVWPLELNSRSFHYQLAVAAPRLFRDEEFAALYCADKGRPSVPPSQLALLVILQTHAGVSDAEAVERTSCDLRWAAVLGRHAGTALCAKSTLQLFRSHLVLHPEFRLLIRRSIEQAKDAGIITSTQLTVALDTKPMLGAGAVEDTYNLLAQAMKQLARALARETCAGSMIDFLAAHDLENVVAPSIKGSVSIDWSNERERDAFLATLVAGARKLLKLADGGNKHVRDNAELLEKLVLQDVAEGTDKDGNPTASIINGTAKGRIPSATDPEQRHGRKSASKVFTGHKTEIVVDAATGIILEADVLSGDTSDDHQALAKVQAAEENAAGIGAKIVGTLGDCAYGSTATRQAFSDAGRSLFAKVPKEGNNKGLFPKRFFILDVVNQKATCPAGKTTRCSTLHSDGGRTFYFDEYCSSCSLRAQCTLSVYGRSVRSHAQETMLQAARLYQNSTEGRKKLRERLAVENGLGRLAHYGIGQARYKGRDKCRFQVIAASCVANLRRSWNFAARSYTQLPNGKISTQAAAVAA